ncbi:MAG: tRNA (adenosine(37)-N6)-threonylcarbamoyltransferase complex transferase subunit TsaD [Terrimicrobiaceae bacterium]|nr:tRNA (adenosine(37)-N6)-threonylcarbamoyltransferase complex transferase subunit TsaD [Terrimicrobiaceae bacterium]
MTILALETSCDETAAAVLEGFGNVLAHEIFSQAEIHAEFGGVVPEVASRNHLESLPFVVDRALAAAGLQPGDLDGIAATTGPGLASALLVGASAAKGLAIGAEKPFVAVNHIEGHLLSPFFGEPEIPPHVALVVSGGHTLLFDVQGFGKCRLLGRTLDDAAGEAFDKVAKLLGLGYPGGVEIDRLARDGDPARYDFPRGMIDSADLNFSFSGLKTAVRIFLDKQTPSLPDLCASFQQSVVDVLVAKAFAALALTGHSCLAISGGVSANAALRSAITRRAGETTEIRFAQDGLRTDNALMIAFAAAHQMASGGASSLGTDIVPNFDAAHLCR